MTQSNSSCKPTVKIKQSSSYQRDGCCLVRGLFIYGTLEERFEMRNKLIGLKGGVVFHEGGLSSRVPLYNSNDGLRVAAVARYVSTS